MAVTGKKINELDSLSTVSNQTVLPAVYVDGSTVNSTAQKISVSQISNKVQSDMSTALANKQDLLTAGNNITISNNIISATDTTYTAGDGISIQNNVISVTDISKQVFSDTIRNMISLTQAQYDTLVQESAVDANTFYIIVG